MDSMNLKCFGRDHKGQLVLEDPISIEVSIRSGEADISMNVKCPHNTGGHGQRCKASHPETDKIEGKEAYCCFSLDIPYSIDYHHDTENENGLETHRRLRRHETLERLRKDNAINREWTQDELRIWVSQMGIEVGPLETIPQGVKYIAWPQPAITEDDIKRGRALCVELGLNGNKEKVKTKTCR